MMNNERPSDETSEIRSQFSAVEQREAAYWDAQVSGIADAELSKPLRPLSPPEIRRLELFGDLSQARILDVGCGTGEWAVQLASRGAFVDAIDISPESVKVTSRRAALHGLSARVNVHVMSAMDLTFPKETFDGVHGQDIIHHLEPAMFGQEISRVLKPGGHAVFRENSANNPILMLARNTLCGRFGIPKWSSDDEYPLTRNRLRQFASTFSDLKVEYPEFRVLFYIDAKLFGYRNKTLSKLVRLGDSAISAVPGIRQYSYKQLICCTR